MFRLRKDNPTEEVAVTVSTETFVRLALLSISVIILFLAAKKAEHALLLIFIAFFLAIALNSPVYWLSKRIPGRRKGNRALATTISFLLVIIVLGIILAMIVPPLIRQTESLVKVAPHLIQEFRSQNGAVGKFIRHYHLQKQVNSFANQLSARIENSGTAAFSTAKHLTTSAFSLLTIVVLTFMMLVEGERWLHFFKDLIPDRHHSLAAQLTDDMYEVVKGYVNGQVLLAALAAVLITPVVLALHIGYPAGLFVVIFICGLIPMIGHTIGAVIVTTVALFHSPTAAIIVLAYYLLYMQVEAYIVQPHIQANSTDMSPLLVFMSVVIGLSFGGIFGALVAIPVAGCLRIAVLEYLYSNKIIEEPKLRRTARLSAK